MPKKCFTGNGGIAALAFGLALSSMPAYAGFQWVAPSDAGAASPAVVSGGSLPAPKMATGGPEVISPVIITGDGGPVIESAPAPTYSAPSYLSKTSEPPSMANATITMPAASGNDIVQGFASQVPLALALRQILPVGTNFSIDQDIDMDTTVSYKGGKSWRETLREMLVPVNLAAHEQGSTITVSHVRAAAVVPVAPVPLSMPVALPQVATASTVTVIDSGLIPSHMNNSVDAPRPATATAPVLRMAETPSFNVNSPDGWSAERGETLRKVLSDWCKRANVELQWLAEYDYPMEASAHFGGGFEDAVRNLLAGFENARPQPVAELHANSSAGQMLLVVQARGNNYSN